MPTAHYIPLSALKENGLHPSSSHTNVTTEKALRLDVNVPRSNPQLASNNGGNNPRTMDVTKDGLNLPASRTNSNSNVKNSRNEKRNCRVRFVDHVEELREYKEKNGHISVRERDDKSLYKWCTDIRMARRNPETCTESCSKRKVTADQIAELDAIGFDWSSETKARNHQKQISFIDRVEALREYKEKNGHISFGERDDKSLYKWCTIIRSARRNPETCQRKVTADRIAALDAIGFDWRSRNHQKQISFIDRVEALREYKEKNGHVSVTKKDDRSLYKWCTVIRSARKNATKSKLTKLTADRIVALDAIGFDWRSRNNQKPSISFIDRVEALREYKEKNGHVRVMERDDKSLCKWCTDIRSARRNPETCQRKVTADRIAALDAIGFDWRLSKSDLQPPPSLKSRRLCR